jgi:hypothetical protein
MRVLPQRTIDALGLQVEVRGQPAKWSGRVARETTPARKRRTTRPFVPCRRRHERSYRHALPSPGVCPPGVPLSELGLVTGPDSRDFPGPQASWPQRALGRSTGPDRGTPIASEPTPAFGAGYGVSASPGGLSQRTTSSRPPARDRLPPRSCIRRKQQSRRRYRLPCQPAATLPAPDGHKPLSLPPEGSGLAPGRRAVSRTPTGHPSLPRGASAGAV